MTWKFREKKEVFRELHIIKIWSSKKSCDLLKAEIESLKQELHYKNNIVDNFKKIENGNLKLKLSRNSRLHSRSPKSQSDADKFSYTENENPLKNSSSNAEELNEQPAKKDYGMTVKI